MKKTTAAFYLLSCLIGGHAFAEETPAFAKPIPSSRKPANMSDVDPVYEEPAMRGGSSSWSAGPHIPNKDGYDGARVQFYYDPMSTYSKLVTNNGVVASQFGYSTVTGGTGGVQAMWAVWAPSDWEFQTGLDYMFPLDVQGAQNQTVFGGLYQVNGQTLNIMGFKALQVNYRINVIDSLTVAPYAGFGVYYGKNSVTLQENNLNNIVNYTKLMAVYTAGARLDFNFNRARTIAAGVGFEFFVPTKITDQLSQAGSFNGGVSSEMPGQSSQLQANMDFWTGIGCKLYGGVAAYF